jgi:hypothetical protein
MNEKLILGYIASKLLPNVLYQITLETAMCWSIPNSSLFELITDCYCVGDMDAGWVLDSS